MTYSFSKKSIFIFCLLFSYSTQYASSSFIFHQTEKTLSKILKIITKQKKGAYLRFGDGDINIAHNQHDQFQKADKNLTEEIRFALSLQDNSVLKSLPLQCKELGGWEPGMFPGNHEAPYAWCKKILSRAQPFWGAPITQVYSPVALCFAATERISLCVHFLQQLKKSGCFALVGNQNIPSAIKNILFGNECLFLPTPTKNAYTAIDNVEKELDTLLANDASYKVIILAMGVSGRALASRLWKKHDAIFLFDFGSLIDALCGWETRAWIELTNFNPKKILDLLDSKIHVVSTAALIEQQYAMRKEEYIYSAKNITMLHTAPSIIESCSSSPTFFDTLTPAVCYTQSNNAQLKNKGVNEAISLLTGLPTFNFHQNDMIIKLTGRYYFSDDSFITYLKNNPTIDIVVKRASHDSHQVFTGCFAMRYAYFIEMLESIDFAKMEKHMINFESIVGDYIYKKIEQKQATIHFLDHLGIVANIFGKGQCQLTKW